MKKQRVSDRCERERQAQEQICWSTSSAPGSNHKPQAVKRVLTHLLWDLKLYMMARKHFAFLNLFSRRGCDHEHLSFLPQPSVSSVCTANKAPFQHWVFSKIHLERLFNLFIYTLFYLLCALQVSQVPSRGLVFQATYCRNTGLEQIYVLSL